jgi:hypothetical protein
MMFVFAAMSDQASGWPVQLMYQTEAKFVIVAFASLLLGTVLKSVIPYQLFAIVGGISAGFALVMPFELAPFFFGSPGETMLGAFALIPIAYPVAVIGFIFLYFRILKLA